MNTLQNSIILTLLTTALAQTAMAEDNLPIDQCIDAAIGAIDIPDSHTYNDATTETATKFIESDTHLASVSAQILPTSRPDERTRIQFNTKFLDESDPDNYYDVNASITFMFNNEGHYIEDLGDIFDAGVWIQQLTPEGLSHYDSTPRLERDKREIWVSQAATTAAFVFSHCLGMDRIMPYGYDSRSVDQPQFPDQALE